MALRDSSAAPFARAEGEKSGAGERTRTADLLITNQLLYQLSYAGNPLEQVASGSRTVSGGWSSGRCPGRDGMTVS